MNTTVSSDSGKTLAEVVSDLKSELKEFVSTRAALFQAEMKGKLRAYKMAAPAIGLGAVVLLTGWFVLTALLIALVAMAFSAPWNYVLALLIVGVAYVAIGGGVAWAGLNTLKAHGLTPKRTVQTLKQDQIWLETETKTQL